MKRLHFHSFRQRLNAAFLAVSLAPLLLCSALLLQIFRFRMTADQQQNAQQQLSSACHALNTMQDGILSAAESLQRDGLFTRALAGAQEDSAKVYSSLYTATAAVRSTARFDLYSADGTLLYSTQAAPGEDALSPDWGILYEAAQAENGTLVYSASEDPTDPDAPVLRAAARLTVSGKTAGFLVAVMYEQQLREALDGMAGAQNELLVMDRFWHGIYCTKPAQVQTLASALRSQLLAGKALTGFSDDFLYTARQDSVTGLYLVLQQPQVFTRGTLRLLYTVSALCALGGAAVSIFLSLQLSRQMFRPIGRLHDAISQVGQNDLQVQVAIEEDRRDELSELAQQFNRMVLSLRRNQQALLENQQALNDAQIRMLQAQLNPHFLCNTLDTMKWIGKMNGVPEISNISMDLADILRACISTDEFVLLGDELELLNRYIRIQRIRFPGRFTYAARGHEKYIDCIVPKLILQPLVENAILHGLADRDNGSIVLSVSEQPGSLLRIAVSDDGSGIPDEVIRRFAQDGPAREGRLGLYNVNLILKKYYGTDFGLHLRNNPEGGATVYALLPITRRETDA